MSCRCRSSLCRSCPGLLKNVRTSGRCLSDLRESGALEQDADIVMFLYRDEYYQREKSEEGTEKTEINIAKHRNGPTRQIELAFERNINAFYNYENQNG